MRSRIGYDRALARRYAITDNATMSTDKTNAQRQANARQRLIAEGGRQLGLSIPPDINAQLSAEMERTGESARAIILRLLQNNLPDAG